MDGAWFGKETPPPVPDLREQIQRLISDAYLGHTRHRHIIGVDEATFNEGSKPVGLTTSHKYTDEDGDTIEATKNHDEPHPVIGVSGLHAYIQPEYSVPLALNVLNHDRPHSLTDYKVTVGEQSAYCVTVATHSQRDKALAAAIADLKSVDRYDQRADERKAEAEAAAKREAEYAKHKQESYDRTKSAYAAAVGDQVASGITAESVAKVQAALSAFETARRKLEGLPS